MTLFCNFWLSTMGIGVLVIEFFAAPFLRWVFHNIPYELPTWNRAMRWAIGIPVFSVFAVTLSWHAEKHSSGR